MDKSPTLTLAYVAVNKRNARIKFVLIFRLLKYEHKLAYQDNRNPCDFTCIPDEQV